MVCAPFFSIPFSEVNVGLLADQVGVATTNTLDPGQGVYDLLFSVNICVEQTKNKLKVRFFTRYDRCIEMVSKLMCSLRGPADLVPAWLRRTVDAWVPPFLQVV